MSWKTNTTKFKKCNLLSSVQHFWHFDTLGTFILTCSTFDLGDQPDDMAASIWFGSGGQWAQVSEGQ